MPSCVSISILEYFKGLTVALIKFSKQTVISALFKSDKQIKKFMGKDDKGKNIYKNTGETRRWVVKYERIDK